MSPLLLIVVLLAVFASGYRLGRDAGRRAKVAGYMRVCDERDRALRLAQECQAHMERVQAEALLAEAGGAVMVVGPVGVA